MSIQIKNEKLKHVLKEAMGEVQGFSWNDAPLNVCGHHRSFLAQTYDTTWNTDCATDATYVLPHPEESCQETLRKGQQRPKALHLQLLVNFLYSEYRSTLDRVSNLLSIAK